MGTRAWILLLVGRDDDDPLFLQAKEAQPSVLERFLEPSRHDNHARRVVAGQRLMQAASDIFLGWQRVVDLDGVTRDYYLRQLHDWKGAVDVESMRVAGATLYARLCGGTLARAHARFGDRIAIAVVPGEGRRVRPGGGRLRRRVRGSERAGLRGARGRREGGHGRRGDRALAAASRADSQPQLTLRRLSTTVASMPTTTNLQPETPAEGLAAVVELRRLADRLEASEVERALRQGWSWSRIAEALGVTRQAVHKKYAKRVQAAGIETRRRRDV